MNLHPWDFDRYTFEEFWTKRKGFYDFYQAGKKIEYQHFRMLAWFSVVPHISKGDQKKGIDVIIPDVYAKESNGKIPDKKAWLKDMQERARNIKLNRNARV